jgi:hypothetical protein
VNLEDLIFARQNHYDISDGLWVVVLLRGYAQSKLRTMMANSIEHSEIPPFAKPSVLNMIRDDDTVLLLYDRAIREVISQNGELNLNQFKPALQEQAKKMNLPAYISQPIIDFVNSKGFYDTLSAQIKPVGELFGAYRAVGNGGLATDVMEAFHMTGYGLLIESGDSVRTILRSLRRSGALVVVGTTSEPRQSLLQQNGGAVPDWWVGRHAYTVLDYDPGTDRVTLRNPWGTHPAPDGTFTLSVNELLAGYAAINFTK